MARGLERPFANLAGGSTYTKTCTSLLSYYTENIVVTCPAAGGPGQMDP